MATRICDTEPCDKMKMALSLFFRTEELENYNPEEGLLIATVEKKKGQAPVDLHFKYCPFCGTRAALGLVDGLEEEYELRGSRQTA
jgi:hypothetical protein